jgi:hypothetical protein
MFKKKEDLQGLDCSLLDTLLFAREGRRLVVDSVVLGKYGLDRFGPLDAV